MFERLQEGFPLPSVDENTEVALARRAKATFRRVTLQLALQTQLLGLQRLDIFRQIVNALENLGLVSVQSFQPSE